MGKTTTIRTTKDSTKEDLKKKKTELRQLWAQRDVRRQLLSNNCDILRSCVSEDATSQALLFDTLRRWHTDAWDLPCGDLPLHFEAMWNEMFFFMCDHGDYMRIKSVNKTYGAQDCSNQAEDIAEKVHRTATTIAIVGMEHSHLNGLYIEKKGTMSSTRPVFMQYLDEKAERSGIEKAAQLYFFEYDNGQRGWYIADSLGKRVEATAAQCKSDARLPYGLSLPWRENGEENPNLQVKICYSDEYRVAVKDLLCQRFERGQCAMEVDCPYRHEADRIKAV